VLDALQSSSIPFVAFVGAGASALPPSQLPTWKGFNELLLECLCERLDDYSRKRQPTARMLEAFKSRRDDAKLLAPDFQAQLMEEEIGHDYFAVWQSLETSIYGPVHAGLAELAARGSLTAVVTTNFDRLIESAMHDRAVSYKVYYNATGFEQLAAPSGLPPGTLPIIKIHGSIEDASSLVDTLRQRMVGRPPALNRALRILLERAPWVFLGSSGADFSYNEHYLGVLDAAKDAKGLVVTRRHGDKLESGVVRLVEVYRSYDPAKAEALEVNPATWLAETFGLPAWTPPAQALASSQADVDTHVKKKIHEWVDRLGPVAVVNIICSMLKSSGLQHEAWWLLRKTFKSYRTPDDTALKSYHRYNYNYGLSLFEIGFISNPVKLADDKSNLLEWKTYADQNAFEFLGRAYKAGGLLPAGSALAALLAYRGEVGRAMGLLNVVTDEAIKREAWLELCDIAVHSVVIYDIVQFFTAGARQIEALLEKAVALGDEPRRAMLCAHLGRLLTYTQEFPKADAMLKEAEQIAERLGQEKVRLTARAARGVWLHDSRTSPQQALETLKTLANDIQAVDDEPLVTKIDLADPDRTPTVLKGHQPMLCRVLLDLTTAALTLGDGKTINTSLDLLDELTVEHFNGYLPHYYFIYAQCLIRSDPPSPDKAVALVHKARSVGKLSGNPWVEQYANYLEPHIQAAAANKG
jgi:hypothetical protein